MISTSARNLLIQIFALRSALHCEINSIQFKLSEVKACKTDSICVDQHGIVSSYGVELYLHMFSPLANRVRHLPTAYAVLTLGLHC